jgi:hypothetical protein
MSTIVAHGPAERAQQIMSAVHGRSESMGRAGDDRSVGERRFDALYDLVLGARDGRETKGRVETQVRLDLTTYLGMNDHPGELVGYGPITAEAARLIAADSTLRRMITDPLTGACIDLGLRSYRPSAALRRAMEASNPTCGMPGCSRPAHTCEADHREERRDGGRTDLQNLSPRCKMHHQMKTKKRWKVDVNPDGTETHTSYLGYTYTKQPSYFPLPDPLPVEDEPPAEIADRLPEAFDPDPPCSDEPLPESPALTEEQYETMARAVDMLDAFGETFQQWCDRHYDQARAVDLVA